MDKISEKIFNELYALHDHYDEDPQHMICAEAADYIKNLSEMLAQSAHPANEPLTLEQLREMCKPTLTQLQQTEPYAPVWIVTLGNKKISCQITRGLIKVDNRCKPPKEYIDSHMIGLLLSDYGKTWLAYARKPEGAKKHEADN